MKEGHIIRSSGPKPLPTHEAAEEMEDMIKDMAKQNPVMALALRCQYFEQCSSREKARRLNLSYSRYRTYIEMAYQWLAGRLTAANPYL